MPTGRLLLTIVLACSLIIFFMELAQELGLTIIPPDRDVLG